MEHEFIFLGSIQGSENLFKVRLRSDGDAKSTVYALKKLQIENESGELPTNVMRELTAAKNLDHPNVVRLLGTFFFPPKTYALLFELAPANLALKIADGCGSCMVKEVLRHVLNGLEYCHSLDVMHRNIQPESVLIFEDGSAKLSSFALTRSYHTANPEYSRDVGKLPYRAPEVLLGLPYTASIDIWAVGCLFVEMVTGIPLFSGNSKGEVLKKIIRVLGWPNEAQIPGAEFVCSFKFGLRQPVSEFGIGLEACVPNLGELGVHLLKRMLSMDPLARISAENALNHPFLNPLP